MDVSHHVSVENQMWVQSSKCLLTSEISLQSQLLYFFPLRLFFLICFSQTLKCSFGLCKRRSKWVIALQLVWKVKRAVSDVNNEFFLSSLTLLLLSPQFNNKEFMWHTQKTLVTLRQVGERKDWGSRVYLSFFFFFFSEHILNLHDSSFLYSLCIEQLLILFFCEIVGNLSLCIYVYFSVYFLMIVRIALWTWRHRTTPSRCTGVLCLYGSLSLLT